MNPLLVSLFALLVFFDPSAARAQGAPTPSYKNMVFTTDEMEETIYKQSPSAQAEARKRAEEQKNGTRPAEASTIDPATGAGFHRLTITPDPGADPKTTDEKAPATNEKESAAPSPAVPAPSGPTPLTPARKLKPMTTLNDLFALAGTPEQIKAGLAPFEEAPGRIPPAGLIQMAALYETLGDMKLAARYYYGAQLRARFDAARFGPGGERLRQQVQRAANDLTARVGSWAAQSSARLNDVLTDVRTWDLATPYDYHPGFGVMAKAPTPEKTDTPDDRDKKDDTPAEQVENGTPSESEWPDLLDDVREKFFRDAGAIARALSQMGK